MTKAAFDKYFITQLPKIEDVSKRLISKNKKYHLDYGIVISYTYEHILRFIDEIEDEKMCQRYIFKFIRDNIYWIRSDMNAIEGLIINMKGKDMSSGEKIDNENYSCIMDELNIKPSTEISNQEDEQDFDNKMIIEKWYSNKEALVMEYRQYETDRVKQIVYDCYFVKGITKGVELAKHLEINKDAGCRLIRELKADIRNFELNQYNKHNKPKNSIIYYNGVLRKEE